MENLLLLSLSLLSLSLSLLLLLLLYGLQPQQMQTLLKGIFTGRSTETWLWEKFREKVRDKNQTHTRNMGQYETQSIV